MFWWGARHSIGNFLDKVPTKVFRKQPIDKSLLCPIGQLSHQKLFWETQTCNLVRYKLVNLYRIGPRKAFDQLHNSWSWIWRKQRFIKETKANAVPTN